MDEFNIGFDPTDEYASIDCDTSDTDYNIDNTTKEASTQGNTCETVATEENSGFTPDKATQNTQNVPPCNNPPVFNNIPQATAYHQVPNHNQPYPVQGVYSPFNQPPVPPYMGQNPGQPTQRPPMPYTPPVYYPQPPHVQHYVPNQNMAFNPPVNPQSTNYNPYANTYNPNITPPKTPAKTKVFIGIMIGLLVVLAIALIVVCTSLLPQKPQEHPLSVFATESAQPDDNYYDNQFGYGIDGQSYEGEYIEYDIVLQADKGQTQELTSSDAENSYPADKDAKTIKTHELPKDKESLKYTTQSAYNNVTDSVVSIVCYDGEISDNYEDIVGEGTGTIITSDGYIVTNSHVISNSKSYTINVIMNNAKEYIADVVGFDSRTDLAVLKIDAKDLPYVTFSNPEHIEVGQDIVAVGNPGGTSFQNSLTKGIVSAVDRELALSSLVKYIQIDAAINPGNSGGPLCNIYGQVIGINTAKISSMDYEGMGFAIPSDTVVEIANDIIKYGYVQDRVRIGILGTEVSYEMAYYYDVPYGILVTGIDKNGPMHNCGILEYDIVTEINSKKVETFQDIYGELENYEEGDSVTITVYRLKY